MNPQNPYLDVYREKRGFPFIITAIIFAITAFGIIAWLILLIQDNTAAKQIVADKSTIATDEARQKQFDTDLANYLAEQNQPNRHYTSPSDVGNISFDYPRDWAIYTDTTGGAADQNVYSVYFGDNNIVPPVKNPNSVFPISLTLDRDEIEEHTQKFDKEEENGTVTHNTISITNHHDGSTITALCFSGEVFNDSKDPRPGQLIYFTVRDKTATIAIYGNEYTDIIYDTILKTIGWDD